MNKYILHLSYRDYNEVPKTLKKNSAELEEIYLKENHIMTIPLWLFQLTNLKFIHLAGNLLTRLPDEISLLVNLEFLDVSSNQLKSIPKTIGEIKNLTRFSARQNQIEELPTGDFFVHIYDFEEEKTYLLKPSYCRDWPT